MSTQVQAPDEREVAARSSEFEGVYRSNIAAVTAFFARRYSEPQTVADLTSQTFVEAVSSFENFDARKGSLVAWLFGIAHHVHTAHYAATINGRHAARRFGGQLVLDEDETEQLAARIDNQRAGRRLLERCAQLPELDRVAIELVDLSGLSPTEAAGVLQVSPGALRVRLFRARARLRKGAHPHDRL